MLDSLADLVASSFPVLTAVVAMTVGAAAFYFGLGGNGGKKITTYVSDLDEQSILHSEKERSRISWLCDDGELKLFLYPDVRTVYDAIRRGLKVTNNGPCLGYRKLTPEGTRPYAWLSYGEVIESSEGLAKYFLHLGISPGQDTFIGIYSRNRPEVMCTFDVDELWVISEQATYVYSMVNVPLYDTLGNEAVCYIIHQSLTLFISIQCGSPLYFSAEIQLIICDTPKKATNLFRHLGSTENLRFVIIMDPIDQTVIDHGASIGVKVLQFDQCVRQGCTIADAPPPTPPEPDDLCTVCYTSGTTDRPKGVMLTHANIVADGTVESAFCAHPITKDDIMISYLPLAHMFERLMEICLMMKGSKIGYYSGDVRKLADDMKALKPTLFPVVPRLMNRVYDQVQLKVSGNVLKKFIFDLAMRCKGEDVKKAILRKNSIWDLLVFKNVRAEFGDNLSLIISGSAPVSAEVLNFFRICFACVVCEGYGQTECVAAASLTLEGDDVAGQVGPPCPANLIKLVDVPEMNYFAEDDCGEICLKGPNVFKGYYKEPEKTAEVIDSDGWLHTGDIGCWTDRGTLRLIDRKKHIFKLAQGEYIAPEKLENVYLHSKFISQIFVHGDSLKSCLVAVVVPNMEFLSKHLTEELNMQNIPADLNSSEAVKKLILNDMHELGKKSGLCSFEQVKDIYISSEPFTVENNLLTPTLKSKRPVLRNHFSKQISKMYESLS
ncbi:long chain fatty acid coenzyme a ligase [Trichuris trichiura]|uniref:Arachidonate--CoA ligase n=1 Tax=Trichuris trichiura TaxID=36087 RepID=A0A077Z504_TRITR|nr:long chain fatty acid coenzyme a ligase [Trichuris trichiura]